MKILKENYEGLKKLPKLPQYLKDFFSNPDAQQALKDSNFESLYKLYNAYSEDYRVIKSHKITQLLNTLNIDPLNHLDYVPDYFLLGSEIKSIIIPGRIKSIGESAFAYCTSLMSITIPDSVISIGGFAFKGCSGLTNLTIPDSVASIGGSAFNGCSGLTSISIPDNVTAIGSYTCYGCTGLTSVTIGSSVTSIGQYAFCGCTGLNYISYKGTKEQWSKIALADGWDDSSSIKAIHCVDGDIEL